MKKLILLLYTSVFLFGCFMSQPKVLAEGSVHHLSFSVPTVTSVPFSLDLQRIQQALQEEQRKSNQDKPSVPTPNPQVPDKGKGNKPSRSEEVKPVVKDTSPKSKGTPQVRGEITATVHASTDSLRNPDKNGDVPLQRLIDAGQIAQVGNALYAHTRRYPVNVRGLKTGDFIKINGSLCQVVEIISGNSGANLSSFHFSTAFTEDDVAEGSTPSYYTIQYCVGSSSATRTILLKING